MVSSMNCNCWASQHCLGHRRLSSYYDRCVRLATFRELDLLSLCSDSCVEDETVDFSGASAVGNLVSFSTWCTSLRVCVVPLSCTPASSPSARFVGVACCWHCSSCLQLAMLFRPLWGPLVHCACSFHPLWVRSSQFFSPTVGPLFSLTVSVTLRVVLNLDHASRRSGPQPLSSGFLSGDHLGHVSESACFTQVLVVVGAAAGCLTFLSVCLSGPAPRSHGVP